MRMNRWIKWLPAMLAVVLVLFFILLYFVDNKYNMPPPYGKDGIILLTEEQLSEDRLLPLVSGWLLSDDQVTDMPTYIGEFSNLQRGDKSINPHGKASYCLTLRYSGEPVEVAVNFPQIFSIHQISLDEKVLSKGGGGAKVSFTLTPGDHLLTVKTFSKQGYYSGLYHPPVLAETDILFTAVLMQCTVYGFALFMSLSLALFTLVLWWTGGDKIAFWLGLLCCSFALYLSYYFVGHSRLYLGEFWYLIQSAALYILCFCVVRVTILAGGLDGSRPGVFIQQVVMYFSLVLLLLTFMIPVFSGMIRFHGMLTDIYYIIIFCSLVFLALRSKRRAGSEYSLTLLACTAFGIGLLCNLIGSNRFEPIRFLWQFEWCGVLLVVLFGAMMSARNKRILEENEAFSNHLEQLVEQRTEELSQLLDERKMFFADMAHDLKAPIYATKSFVEAIRSNNTGVDEELLHYFNQIEQKQQEIAHRVQSLTTFNELESIGDPGIPIAVNDLLLEAYAAHHMAAEVVSVHLVVLPSEKAGRILAQPKKMNVLLENLIFNALHATSLGGSITLSAEVDETECHLAVADTGGGIPIDELPHIFQRFFVGKENKSSGSGLGLYIAKSIVEELHGEISVSSKPGQGTVFYIDLPIV